MKRGLFILLLVLSMFFVYSEDAIQESIYPTTVGELEARVTLFGSGVISGLKNGEEAKFQTITFQNTPLQSVKILKEELNVDGTIFYPKIVLDKFGNEYASYIITKNGSFNYEITADVNVTAAIPELTDMIITDPKEIVKQYTLPSEKVESSSLEIKNLTKNKFTSTNFLETLNSTVLWVNDYVEYAKGSEFNKYYLQQKTAVETLLNRKGVCDEFANLATAILRAKEIPTRLSIGITFDGTAWGNHAWIEVYDEKQNEWIPSDPTFREAGFVDATHIKMGSFSDVSLSLAKATYPSTANVTFDTQSKLPKVEIKKVKYFNLVTINESGQEVISNTWNEIKISITNNTKRTLNAPISIKENYNEIVFQEKRKTQVLGPNETKEISFKIYPLIDLSENQIAKGTLTFNSLSEPKKQDLLIKKGNEKEKGELLIEDITPITHEGKLLIQIKATNYMGEDKIVDYSIISKSYSTNSSELIPKFSSKIIEIDIDKFVTDENYLITITTPTSIYTQNITPSQQTLITQKPIEKQTVVEQKIDTNTTQEGNFFKNPIILMVGILIVVGLLLMGILWTNKRYI